MSRFGGFLARKPTLVDGTADSPAKEAARQAGREIDIDEELFSSLGSQMGGENEKLRNLLIDAGFKITELDNIRDTIGQLIDPVAKTLKAYEAEKAERAGLQTILNNTRTEYGKLRNLVGELETKATAFEGECLHLRAEYASQQQTIRAFEAKHTELTADIAARRSRIADLVAGLKQITAEATGLREGNLRLNERLSIADKRSITLETELNAAKQKLALLENERRALQASLEKSVNETARVSRRLAEAENALAGAQTRLRQVEGNYTEADNERVRLMATLEQANEQRQGEAETQRIRFEALQARANASDKLLQEAREQLTARAEELRNDDRRLAEAAQLCNSLQAKIAENEAGRFERDAVVRDLEQSRAALLDRNATLTKALATRESALNRTEEKAQSLADRVAILESQMETARQLAENEKNELNAALKREQLERTVVEAALETGRKDISRLLREVMSLQRRQSDQEPAPKPRAANAA